jgi:predicted DNA-binding transcriptional regulator AlpA
MVSSSNKESVERHAKMLTDCAASNLSVRQYALSQGISDSVFYRWIKYFKARMALGETFPGLVLPEVSRSSGSRRDPEIVEISAHSVSCPPRLSAGILGTITFKNQATLDISGNIDSEQLEMLIKAVSSC